MTLLCLTSGVLRISLHNFMLVPVCRVMLGPLLLQSAFPYWGRTASTVSFGTNGYLALGCNPNTYASWPSNCIVVSYGALSVPMMASSAA